MKLIYTKSSQPLSVLIRWALKEPVSHFAIVFDNGFVFHSNLLGVHPQWFATFKKSAEVVFELDYEPGLEAEEECWQKIVTKYDGRMWDFKAAIYWGYRLILKGLFGLELPVKNAWASADDILCTEMSEVLPDEFLAKMPKLDFAITSPYQHYWRARNILEGKVN